MHGRDEKAMNKQILDLSKSVNELCKTYPDLVRVLDEIGFYDITKPGMLASVGRFMTIPKGAVAKKIDRNRILEMLHKNGFEVINEDQLK
jgi:hypothetical protein